MRTTEIRTEQAFKVSEVQVSYKPAFKPSERPQISNSRELVEVIRSSWDASKISYIEEFKIVLMNKANRVIGIFTVSQGETDGNVADPKVVFAVALKAGASQIALVHNHPSGALKANHADISLTNKLKTAGEYLDLKVIDHIILTSEDYLALQIRI